MYGCMLVFTLLMYICILVLCTCLFMPGILLFPNVLCADLRMLLFKSFVYLCVCMHVGMQVFVIVCSERVLARDDRYERPVFSGRRLASNYS